MSFTEIIQAGYRPFISTSSFLRESLQLEPFGLSAHVIDESEANLDFHHAYLLANTLAFGSAEQGLGMPGWVYTDIVLAQTAVVGWMAPLDMCPREYVQEFERDPKVNLSALEYLPVTAQIAGLTADQNNWFGFSLISHQTKFRFQDGLNLYLAAYAKALSLEVYGAKKFMGLTQYKNSAIRYHGLFGRMFIRQPMVWTHNRPLESFIYGMDVEFDKNSFYQIDNLSNDDYDFLLNSNDDSQKREIENEIKVGIRHEIVSPYQIKNDDGSRSLPIVRHPTR